MGWRNRLAARPLTLALAAAAVAATTTLAAAPAAVAVVPKTVSYAPLLTDPGVAGRWSVTANLSDADAIHGMVLPPRPGERVSHRVLLVEGSGLDPDQFAAGTFRAYVLDTETWQRTDLPLTPTDLFCGAHTLGADGKVRFFGGTVRYSTATRDYGGSDTIYEFDPALGSFQLVGHMQEGRWYPEAVTRGDGKVALLSGNDADGLVTGRHELFDPATNATTALPWTGKLPLYPQYSLMPDGRLFGSGAANDVGMPSGYLSLANGTFQQLPGPSDAAKRGEAASLLLYPAQKPKVLLVGGGQNVPNSSASNTSRNADLIDLTAAAPRYSVSTQLPAGKVHVLGVNLPDGTALETGGAVSWASPNEILEASTYDPASGSWRRMNPPTVGRSYHSLALLLPDGSVLTAGGDAAGAPFETRVEVFQPPYFFKGQRPAITAAPATVSWGQSVPAGVTVQSGAAVDAFILMRAGSATHSTDPDQRSVDVPFTRLANGTYQLSVPSNPNVLPPGPYLLFARDNRGRPSVGSWVFVGAPAQG